MNINKTSGLNTIAPNFNQYHNWSESRKGNDSLNMNQLSHTKYIFIEDCVFAI